MQQKFPEKAKSPKKSKKGKKANTKRNILKRNGMRSKMKKMQTLKLIRQLFLRLFFNNS